jgi:hypothetical protein
MKISLRLWSLVIVLGLVMAFAASTALAKRGGEGGRGDGPIIWVINQQLFYDSIVTADPLPPKGPFQELRMDGPGPDGLQTQYGPGDPGYVGGRWWVDVNNNDEMDPDDRYFSCPLLGPGRPAP